MLVMENFSKLMIEGHMAKFWNIKKTKLIQTWYFPGVMSFFKETDSWVCAVCFLTCVFFKIYCVELYQMALYYKCSFWWNLPKKKKLNWNKQKTEYWKGWDVGGGS